MIDRLRRLHVPWPDWLLSGIVVALSQLQIWLADPGTTRVVASVTEAVSAVSLAWRRRAPLASQAGVILPFIVPVLWEGRPTEPGPIGIAWLVAVYSATAYAEGRKVFVAIGMTLLVNVIQQARGGPATLNDLLAVFLLSSAVPLLAGLLRRRHVQARLLERRAETLSAEHDRRTAAAIADERARIARELHDVVAHGVSVMVVQAEAADAVFDRDPISVRDALKSIQSSGREALVDLRRMLGVLREAPTSPVAPQPSLARLGELADQMRTAGLDIDVRIEGPSLPLPRGLDLAAYRIVQEALTNVLKHAGRERVHVLVRYAPDHVELEVCNDGRRVKLRNGGGHGLAGISERVAVFGGSYEAAPRPEGGFVVRVRLPIGSSV